MPDLQEGSRRQRTHLSELRTLVHNLIRRRRGSGHRCARWSLCPVVSHPQIMRILACIVAAALVAGCGTPAPVHLAEIPGEKRIAPTDPVLVAISPELASRIEKVGDLPVVTGETWRAVFIGDSSARWRFELTSSKLEQSIAGAGFTMRMTYTAEGILTNGSQRFTVSGQGSRAAGMAVPSAMRQAVELAVVDIARRCRHLIAESERTVSAH